MLHPNKQTMQNEPDHKMNKSWRISNTFYTLLCSQDRATLESDLSGLQRFKADSRSVFNSVPAVFYETIISFEK